MSVNLVAFYNSILSEQTQAAESIQKQRDCLLQELGTLPGQRQKIDDQRTSVLDLKTKAESAGLDTTPLSDQLAKLELSGQQLDQSESAINAKLEAVVAPSSDPRALRQAELAACATEIGFSNAELVSGVEQCLLSLPFWFTADEHSGKPLLCIVELGARTRVRIPIDADGRVISSFVPEELRWCTSLLPRPLSMASPKMDHCGAYVDVETNKLMVASHRTELLTRYRSRIETSEPPKHPEIPKPYSLLNLRQRMAYGKPPETDPRSNPPVYEVQAKYDQEVADRASRIAEAIRAQTEAASDEVVDLWALVTDEVSRGGGLLTLGEHAPNSLLLERLQAAIRNETVETTKWAVNSGNVKTAQAFERIRSDWTAFVEAPWTNQVDASLALLKYLAESGERPRFWCEHYCDLFGFRLRTRDHTWLHGRIFIDRQRSATAEEQSVIECREEIPPGHGSAARVARIGKMSIFVWIEN